MLVRAILLITSAAVLVSAQTRPNPGPILGCTTNSFQIPSWLVQGLKYSEDTLSFHLLNRATNFSTTATCKRRDKPAGNTTCSIQDERPLGEVLVVSSHVEGDVAEILVSETWSCNDRKGVATPSLQFGALGYLTAHLTCATPGICESSKSSLLIKGTLFSPITGTPPYIDGPEGHNTAGCTKTPGWTLAGISYLNQTGNGASTATFENFNLVITNLATGYQASCMIGSGKNLRCSGSEFGRLKPDRYTVETAATFDFRTFEFAMNQTWYCDESDPAKPVSITAGASTILPLKCVTENIEGTISDICRVTNDEHVTLKGQLLNQKALPAYSIIDPVLGPDGCTAASILGPSWRFNYFHIDQSKDNTTSSVGFNIILSIPKPSFVFPLSISQDLKPLANNSEWYPCVIGPFDPYEERLYPKECSLKYDAATKELTLKADWECSDLDENYP